MIAQQAQQGARGAHSLLNPQEQVVTEHELAKRVAAQAAAQAAYKSSNVQNERASKELHDAYIAQESARSVPASFSANQLGSQQVVSIPSCRSGFIRSFHIVRLSIMLLFSLKANRETCRKDSLNQLANMAVPSVHLSVVREYCCKE